MYYAMMAAVGAVIAVLVSALGRSNLYIVSALIPFFPTFSLLAYFVAHGRGNTQDLGRIIQFNMVSMLPFLAFAVSMYFLHAVMNFYGAIAASLGVWFVAAFATYYIYTHVT